MSNNGDVEYHGDSYFFTDEKSHMVAEIERDSNVGLSFAGARGIIGQRPLFIAVEGHAELIRHRAAFKSHWTAHLDRWFENGPETPGIVLIKVHASRLHYWEGMEHGELEI
jgi:general stress protein 26